jgi:hypothetical protein
METHGNAQTQIVVPAAVPPQVRVFRARVRELRYIDMDAHA